jgi:hypothetical protein
MNSHAETPRAAADGRILRVAPIFTTLTTIGLAVALLHEGPTATVTVTGALFALIAAAMTLLTLRHQLPRAGATPAADRDRFDRIDGAVAGVLNLLAAIALVVLWLSPAALFFVALGLVPIAFTCLVIISWPH